MRNFDKKIIIIYTLILTFILFTCFFSKNIVSMYSMYINPLFWLSLLLISVILFKDKKVRYKGINDKI